MGPGKKVKYEFTKFGPRRIYSSSSNYMNNFRMFALCENKDKRASASNVDKPSTMPLPELQNICDSPCKGIINNPSTSTPSLVSVPSNEKSTKSVNKFVAKDIPNKK